MKKENIIINATFHLITLAEIAREKVKENNFAIITEVIIPKAKVEIETIQKAVKELVLGENYEDKEMKEKIELDLELLEAISAYYEFPLATFFSPIESFKGKKSKSTRFQCLTAKAEAFDRIVEIVEEETER